MSVYQDTVERLKFDPTEDVALPPVSKGAVTKARKTTMQVWESIVGKETEEGKEEVSE